MKYYVEVVKIEEDEVVERMGPHSDERWAERIEDGVNINLNHEKYYTRVAEGEK